MTSTAFPLTVLQQLDPAGPQLDALTEIPPLPDELLLAPRDPAPPRRPTVRRQPVLRLGIAALAILVVGTGTYAVPTTRAAVDGLYGSLSAWVGGDGAAAPGEPAPADATTPDWVTDARGEKRLIAGREGANLYVVRDGDELTMAIGVGHGQTATIDSWRRQLARHRIVVLGLGDFPAGGSVPGGVPLDARDRRALMGLTSRDVARVELRYATGAPTVEERLNGGFVLLADAHRRPRSLVAYGADGRQLERVDVRRIDLRVCRDARGCPPGAYDPPASAG